MSFSKTLSEIASVWSGGTDGQVITYDASGDPVAVGPGTDGQVLTSTGAGSPPAFEAVAAPAHTTVTNSYEYLDNSELNSLGVLKHIFFGASYYFTTSIQPSGSAWTQLTGWTKMVAASTGAANADPFGKFNSGTGVWEPAIAGYYLCILSLQGTPGNDEEFHASIRRYPDGSPNDPTSDQDGIVTSDRVNGYDRSVTCSVILPCDANDTITFWGRIDSGSKSILGADSAHGTLHPTKVLIAYMGSSTL